MHRVVRAGGAGGPRRRARADHRAQRRRARRSSRRSSRPTRGARDKPFVKVNVGRAARRAAREPSCSAPRPGAYTGATKRRIGPLRGRRRRHAVPRRDRQPVAGRRRRSCCACCRAGSSSGWAPARRAGWTCGCSPPPTPTCARPSRAGPLPRGPVLPPERDRAARCRRCATAPRTSCRWPSSFLRPARAGSARAGRRALSAGRAAALLRARLAGQRARAAEPHPARDCWSRPAPTLGPEDLGLAAARPPGRRRRAPPTRTASAERRRSSGCCWTRGGSVSRAAGTPRRQPPGALPPHGAAGHRPGAAAPAKPASVARDSGAREPRSARRRLGPGRRGHGLLGAGAGGRRWPPCPRAAARARRPAGRAGSRARPRPPLLVALGALGIAAAHRWPLCRRHAQLPRRRLQHAAARSTRRDELGELVRLYNQMGDALRSERHDIYQRELLLDTVLQGAPMAAVLTGRRRPRRLRQPAARDLLGRAGGWRAGASPRCWPTARPSCARR